jgi:hypothetical protein
VLCVCAVCVRARTCGMCHSALHAETLLLGPSGFGSVLT